jgi:hypothetical protein
VQRKEFLQRLIDAARSPHSVVKRYVASQFKECFKDFPDLQNDVIDAVFDLCEDSDREVRQLFVRSRSSDSVLAIGSHAGIQGHRRCVVCRAEVGEEERRRAHTVTANR